MREKERKRQIKRMRDLVAKWAEPMGLLWWKIDVVYYGGYDECKQLFSDPKSANRETVAITDASWKYLEATIEVNLQRVARMDDDKLEEVVVHELAHVLVNEMREEGDEHEERVVTTVVKALRWTRGYGRKEGARSKKTAKQKRRKS
jgi:predicted aminopeptidase